MDWFFSFSIMNSFNKTEAAIFPEQNMFPEDFTVYQIDNKH